MCLCTAAVTALGIRTAFRNRDYATPITVWETAVSRRPQGRARFALATEYIGAGRHDEAIAQLREAVADYPDARAGLGAELVLQGQTAEGIEVLEQFIRVSPDKPNRIPARILMGQAFLSQGRIDEAAGQYTAVLHLDSSSIVANQGMGAVARVRAARLLEQQRAAEAAVQAHNILGAALASQGQIAEAIAEFETTLRINPQHVQASNNLARAKGLSQK
jgi:tetratricopeptide (TPR) repeat protein